MSLVNCLGKLNIGVGSDTHKLIESKGMELSDKKMKQWKKLDDNIKEKWLEDAARHYTRRSIEERNNIYEQIRGVEQPQPISEAGARQGKTSVWSEAKSWNAALGEQGGGKSPFAKTEEAQRLEAELKTLKKGIGVESDKTQADRFRAFKTMSKGFKNWFAPEAISENAKIAEAVLSKRITEKENEQHIQAKFMGKTIELWDTVPEAEQLKFFLAMDENAVTKGMMGEQAKFFRDILDSTFTAEMKAGLNLNYVKDYMPRQYERPEQYAEWLNSKIKSLGDAGFTKERYFDLLRDAYDAGFRLKESNPAKAVLNRLYASDKAITNEAIMQDFKKVGMAIEAKGADDVIGDIVAVNGKHWIIEKSISPIFKNAILGQQDSLWTKDTTAGMAYRLLMKAKNTLVPLKLLGAFHFIHVTTMTAPQRRAVILEHIIKDGKTYDGMLKDLLKASAFVDQGYKSGGDAITAWGTPEESRTPIQQQMVNTMVDGGFRPIMSHEFKSGMREQFQQSLRQNNKIMAALTAFPALIDTMQAPLMEKYIPQIKTSAYLYEAQRLLDRKPELLHDDIARMKELVMIRKSIDNRFGELNTSTLFWNKLIKEVAIGSSLSLGWNLGFLREYGGGAIDAGKFVKNLIQNGGKTWREDVSRRMLFTLDYSIQSMVIGGLISYALSGSVNSIKDLIFPRTGAKNNDGTDERLTTPFYTKEFFAWLEHMRKEGIVGGQLAWMKNKANPVVADLLRVWDNKDFYGTEIRHLDDNPISQIWDVVKYLGSSVLPISLNNLQKGLDKKSVSAYTGLAGFNIAPAYATKTKALQKVSDIVENKKEVGARTKEQFETSQLMGQLRNDVRSKQGTERIREALQQGKISKIQARSIIQDSTLTPLQSAVKHLSVNEVMQVWQVATPDEKHQLKPFLSKKMQSVKNMSGEKRIQTINRFQALQEED